MSEQYGLSRELAENEVPPEANERLEQARPVDRRGRASGGRASATEEKPGTAERPSEPPVRDARPDLKPPPFEPPNY
jgi:hypothetical protein